MGTNQGARAFRSQGNPDFVTADATTMVIDDSAYAVIATCTSSQNVDVISTAWYRGRQIRVKSAAGSSANITFRDDQAGTNLILIGSVVALGAHDSVEFMADYDSSGNEMWVQSMGLCNIS